MKSLLWKQWRESRGLLGVFTAWMVVAVVYVIGYELSHHYRAVVGAFSGWASFYGIVAALVLAMRTARGEEGDGTMSFSAALPVSLRRMAMVRIAGAVAALAIPIVIGAILLSLALLSGIVEQAASRGATTYGFTRLLQREDALLITALDNLWSVTAIAIFGGVQLLLVLSLLGCWLRNQAQIGLLGVVVAMGAMMVSGFFWFRERNAYAQLAYGALLPQSLVVHWGYGDETGSYTDHELAQYRWIAMGLAIPWQAMIGGWFVTRYGGLERVGRPKKPWRYRVALPPVLSHIPIRWPSRWMSLVWLELRQSVPLAVFGFVLAILFAVAGVLLERRGSHTLGTAVLMDMPHSMFVIGTLWAVVVGSALYSADLGAGLGGFWRSRPISPAMWFWSKFLIGLVAVLVVLDGATILMSWNAPRESPTTGMSWAYVGCFPIMHALMYVLAVLGTCWLRKPVMGGILAILAFAAVTTAIAAFPMTSQFDPIDVYNNLLMTERGGRVDFTQHGYPVVYGILAAAILVLGVVASRLVRPLEARTRWFGAG